MSFLPSCSTPVVVEMAHFVCELLQSIWSQTECVMDDVIRSWTNGSLTNRLTDEEEVIARINNCKIDEKMINFYVNTAQEE